MISGTFSKGRDSIRTMFTWEADALMIGRCMEEAAELIRNAVTEAGQAKRELGDLLNQVRAVADVVIPLLEKQAKEVRSARMSVVGEVHELMKPLKDIRKFFLDSDYQFEMDRLERFIRVCKDLKDLKESGILDAVSDVAIRLACREVER